MKRFFTILAFIVLATPAYLQTAIPKAEALFIYNFSRLIEWPVNYRSGPFIIGVIGPSEVADELENYTKGKKVGTQDIQVMRYKTPQDIAICHILFIPFSRTKEIGEITSALSGKSTLLITEKSGALNEGSAINFIILNDKMKFEINSGNASKYGIKLSSKLQEMSMQ